MESYFNISLQGFNSNEDANSIGKLVLNATKSLAETFSLDISKLKSVVISYDFPGALSQVTSEYNHSIPSSFTDSKQATAIGQLVSKVGLHGLCEEYTLVLSVNFFVELFNEKGNVSINDEGVRNVIHRLHHELVHVHEKNTLTCLPQDLSVNEYGDVLLISATRAWSEYLANFISSRSVTEEILDDFLANLETVINEVPIEIDDIVWNYKNSIIPLNEMYLEVKKRVRLIINSYGYAIGYVHGVGIKLEEYSPQLADTISCSKIRQPLIGLSNAFEDLIKKFNDSEIKSFDDFGGVMKSIEAIFDAFGLTLECVDWSESTSFHIDVR